jgi:hypothetical protein
MDSGSHHDSTVLGNPDTGMLAPSDTGNGGGMDACAVTTATANQTPLDIYFLLDRSGSMAYNNAWTDEVQALQTFIDDYRSNGIGVGLGYMPQVDECDVAAYIPDVPIAPLPGPNGSQQGALITSLSNNQPFGGTPVTVGLEGAVAAAKANQKAHPDHTTVIVFSNNGVTLNGCEVVPDGGLTNSTANAISVIAAANASDPPLRTFVIGIAGLTAWGGGQTIGMLIPPATRENDYAMAGGTGTAILIGGIDGGLLDGSPDGAGVINPDAAPAVVNIEGALIQAFGAIRTQALPCEYSIPQADAGTINFSDVNVTFAPSTGPSQQFYGVSSASACQSNTNDWYYDSTMTHIELCPNACATVKAATIGKVNVDYGCLTIAPPIAK